MPTNSQRCKSLFEWAQVICAALLCITCLYTFGCRMIEVHGSSMETTLADGDRLLLSSLPYTPQYGDIVVVDRGEGQEPLIKRVIGLAGDTVWVDESSGTVYRNGECLAEPYVTAATDPEKMEGPVTVPSGMVFVMGDNRTKNHSLDSRTFGCVSQEAVIGKAFYRLLPWNQGGAL